MIITCSDKVINEFKVNTAERVEVDPLFSWQCQLTTINYRKTLILVNHSNGIVVVLYHIKIKEYPYLKDNILKAIREVFTDQMLLSEAVDKYLQSNPEVIFAEKFNSDFDAKLQTVISEVELLSHFFDKKSVLQLYVSRLASQSLRAVGKEIFSTPYELLYMDFARVFGGKIIDTAAFSLRIELEMQRNDVWCELIIPENYYFESLHNLIQGVFNWGDEFLHDFHIYNEERELFQIVCHEEFLEYGVDVNADVEWRVKLKDIMPKFKFITYVYDFDANFVHRVRLTKILDKYEKPYATCVGGCKIEPLNTEHINGVIKYIR